MQRAASVVKVVAFVGKGHTKQEYYKKLDRCSLCLEAAAVTGTGSAHEDKREE